ncbi:MAG: toll/interleukin-1 receptor domain-containing protein [Spirochaetota bacterium]
MTKAFISYSWDSDAHRDWVLELATRLRADGVETVLDQWHLVPGDQLPAFMETAVRDSDYVLIVCTPRYKDRSERRIGGVGYEGDIITGEVLTTRNERKFIPILRTAEWAKAAPQWLSGKYHVDLRNDPYSERHYQDLLTTLLGTRLTAPPVRHVPELQATTASRQSSTASPVLAARSDEFEPIHISGIIVDEIGTPRGDGSPGSALYAVPFRFTRRPPPEWAQVFLQAWDHPSQFTTMHRPGIAMVHGDRVILDGTTVEEVEQFHRATLLLATEEANKTYSEWQRRQRAEEAREQARIEEHKKKVEDAAKRLKF